MMSLQKVAMRTTVTLDPDVKALLTEAAYRIGKPFKATLNDAVRAGLAPAAAADARHQPPDWPCHDMGAPLIDLRKAMALADQLEDQALAAKLARGA